MEIIYLDRLFSQLYLLPPLLGFMFHISSEVLSKEGRRQRGVFCSAAEREMAPTRQMVAKGGEGGRTQLMSELRGREDAEYQDQVNNYEIKFETDCHIQCLYGTLSLFLQSPLEFLNFTCSCSITRRSSSSIKNLYSADLSQKTLSPRKKHRMSFGVNPLN